MTNETGSAAFERVDTGVSGLDRVLHGGLLDGGLYIVVGTPGAGKTILANQFCFHRAKGGAKALFVTMLGESHGRMLRHLSTLDFFDPSLVSETVFYLSGAQAIEGKSLRDLTVLLRREMAARQATVLVLEGLFSATVDFPRADVRKFIYQLQNEVQASGCVALLTSDQLRPDYHPEYTLVDGIIFLQQAAFGSRTMRQLQVQKFRGSSFVGGKHDYEISNSGIAVFPRTEAIYAQPSGDDLSRGGRTTLGVAEMDTMLGGGLPSGTTTLVLGPSGIGKTVLGLNFMCATPPHEPALLLSFYETPERLLMKARSLGLGLDELVADGTIQIMWQSPGADSIDKIADRLLDAVAKRGVRRLFIDGMQGFEAASVDSERLTRFFSALFNELRVRDVTSLYTGETQIIIGSEVRSPVNGLSMLAENILLLRFVEVRSQISRIFSALKVRDSEIDGALREFRIGAGGITLEKTSDTAERLLEDFKRFRVVRTAPEGEPGGDPNCSSQ